MDDKLIIKGAREHNLKNVDLELPRNKLIVFTGLSGSGKSSLAFDTIFAEGQRRYVESLSSYARLFLGQMDKPDVDSISGLSPAIAIDQKSTSNNPRSIVGTTTEIYDYLRLLYARVGTPHCPKCGKEITKITVDQICDSVLSYPIGTKLIISAPIIRGRKGEYVSKIEGYHRQGYSRVIIDGETYSLDEDEIKIDAKKKHNIEVVVDRLIIKEGLQRRLTDSIETALGLAKGLVMVYMDGKETLFSTKYACPDCDVSMEELAPRLFSFNNPFGACPVCSGLGFKQQIDLNRVFDFSKGLGTGAVKFAWGSLDGRGMYDKLYDALSEKFGFDLSTPLSELPKNILDIIMYGTDEKITVHHSTSSFNGNYNMRYEGLINTIWRRYQETSSPMMKREYEKLMLNVPCEECNGRRLKKEALAVTVGGLNISQLCDLSVTDALRHVSSLSLSSTEAFIADQILKSIKTRLTFLSDVGLNYLTLSRPASSLSGGESQRIRLATQIGSGLVGVLYILDEPSIGLHQRDNGKLIEALKKLQALGNTLIVVEHDEETIRSADFIVDVGKGAGVNGGEIIAQGSLDDIMNNEQSITGQYLSGKRFIPIPRARRIPKGYMTVRNARQNNLKGLDVNIPLGVITAVTGVSGSGKSSLVNGIIYPFLANKLNKASLTLGRQDSIEGYEELDKVICIDQSPIGRTPRSNPATYTGVFTEIRDLFAKSPDAMARGYKASRFSFNVSGGRCENCSGDGYLKIEMHFLPDVYAPCEVCKGKRYNRETLEVKFKDKSIADVLDMTVAESVEFFRNIPSIYRKVKTLYDVGLSYIKLGQPATTLSGGEAQRVKLATELAKRGTGRTIYILDEPTTGLHTDDVDKLVKILDRLVESGNTVLVIEHNLDVVKVADYIIDLGPEGGDEGGTIVATGTPEAVASNEKSYTGKYLADILKRGY